MNNISPFKDGMTSLDVIRTKCASSTYISVEAAATIALAEQVEILNKTLWGCGQVVDQWRQQAHPKIED